MGTRGSFSSGIAAGAWSSPLTSIWGQGQECVEIYLHYPNTHLWRGAHLKRRELVVRKSLNQDIYTHVLYFSCI
jgi:hypothetical protein